MIIIINIIIDIIDITILQRQLQVDDVHVSDELYGQTGVHPQAEVCMYVCTSGNSTHVPFITTYDIVHVFFFNTSCCLG